MYYNKHSNDLTESEINCQTHFSHKPLTQTENKINTKSGSFPTPSHAAKNQENVVDSGENEKSDAGIAARSTIITSNSSDSTDSGVNFSDNDDIPPPSPKSTQRHSFETNSAASHGYKILHKHNKNIVNRDNNVNNRECSNSKHLINSNNNKHFINYNNDVDDCEGKDENIHSQNFDNKFKVTNSSSSSEGYSTRYQQKTQNFIDGAKEVNICQQRNLETKISTPQPIAATSKNDNDKPSFQHNEFIHLQQQHSPATSSLSLSFTTNSYNNNPPNNMPHYKGSPVVSIRSINSTIITSDSDIDSDLSSDTENYMLKKLGTQVTYSPNDPAITHINSGGRKLLNQKVIVNSSNQAPLPPTLEALADIGDRIGAAQALGPVPSNSGVAQRPQIGSIALNNSSDVTFGDKHFYEGPVTIQQFLIDSRDKWKQQPNGKENPTFQSENVEASLNNAKDINSGDAEKYNTVYEYILKHKKMIIPGVLAFTTLLLVAIIWGSKMSAESKNTDGGYNSDDCESNKTFCLIERSTWRAHLQTGTLVKQKLPLHRVVISHTASEPCVSTSTCADRVRVIQEFHMNSMGWDDIGYNFLISSDGRVFVGRGWDYVGAHTKGYNYDSVGISFIGTYNTVAPTEVQLNACLALQEEGVRLNKLVPDYRLYGARQLGATESPGEMLFKRIKQWKHFTEDIEIP